MQFLVRLPAASNTESLVSMYGNNGSIELHIFKIFYLNVCHDNKTCMHIFWRLAIKQMEFKVASVYSSLRNMQVKTGCKIFKRKPQMIDNNINMSKM